MEKNIIVFIIIVATVATGVYYFSYKKGFTAGYEMGKTAGQINASTAVSNPLEEMPSTNPFEESINPFKDVYTNPFK